MEPWALENLTGHINGIMNGTNGPKGVILCFDHCINNKRKTVFNFKTILNNCCYICELPYILPTTVER